MQYGLVLTDGSGEDEIDVTIGSGSSSVTTIAGDLTVNGTTTTINSTTVSIDDLVFSIATDAADSAAADGAGITIGGASATLLYDHTGTQWEMNKPLEVTGAFACSGAATLASLVCTAGATFGGGTGDSGVTISTAGAITADAVIKTESTTDATSTTDGSIQTDGGLSVALDAVVGNDIKLLSDSSVVHFGANSELTLSHVHDTELTLKHTATADDKPVVLTLATGETDIAVDDVIGTINFQAPDEGTGTDAILVAAGIEAVSEGHFAADNNATKLSFKTAASAAAAETMSLSSAGVLTTTGAIELGNASDTTVARSAAGVVTVEGFNVAIAKSFVLTHTTGIVGSSGAADGNSTSFVVSHGFPATKLVKAEVLLNSGQYDTVHADITRAATSSVTVTFASAVAESAYVLLLTRVG